MAVIGATDGTGIGPAKDDADQRAGSASPGAKLVKADCVERCPLSGVTRKTFAPLSSSEFAQFGLGVSAMQGPNSYERFFALTE